MERPCCLTVHQAFAFFLLEGSLRVVSRRPDDEDSGSGPQDIKVGGASGLPLKVFQVQKRKAT